MIRKPGEAYGILQDTQVYTFVSQVAEKGSSHIPLWVQSIAQSIAGKTHIYKALKELETESKRLKMSKMKAKASHDAAEKAELKNALENMAAEKQAAEARLAELLAAQVEQDPGAADKK